MRHIVWLMTCLLLLAVPAASADVYVNGYYKKDGTYVAPHYRSSPDGDPYNNWSYPGNTNPYTGETATGDPCTYLKNEGDGYSCGTAADPGQADSPVTNPSPDSGETSSPTVGALYTVETPVFLQTDSGQVIPLSDGVQVVVSNTVDGRSLVAITGWLPADADLAFVRLASTPVQSAPTGTTLAPPKADAAPKVESSAKYPVTNVSVTKATGGYNFIGELSNATDWRVINGVFEVVLYDADGSIIASGTTMETLDSGAQRVMRLYLSGFGESTPIAKIAVRPVMA